MADIQFKIFKMYPMEEILDGKMTFAEARKYMDEHASHDRPVCYRAFNPYNHQWYSGELQYCGGRKVYDNLGLLYILDPDYRNMWRPGQCTWYLWEVSEGRKFIQSYNSNEMAEMVRTRRQEIGDEERLFEEGDKKVYVVEPCDVKI
jgi:hypothetical protein